MAAGASSPELVCTLLSIFITHSSLGLGTIVGSVIFNQSVICAGSVYASKPKLHPYNVNPNTSSRNTEELKYLVLDKVMIIREVGFYALSIGLMAVALSESRCEYNDNNNNGNQNNDGNEEYGVEHIYVSFWRASVLLGGYILYVVVCSNMEKCMALAAYLQRLLGFSGASSSDDKAIQLDKTKAPSNDEWSMAENERIHYKVSIIHIDQGRLYGSYQFYALSASQFSMILSFINLA